jgi:acyl carrier protein phosphodiesterase
LNYLAHFQLARHSDGGLLGALLGEYIKGPLRGAWPAEWEQGIRLHRRIDAFSDRHDSRLQFAEALPAEYRRYAGIVFDVWCDYLLSRHWNRFEAQRLDIFAARVYALLEQHMAELPPPAARMARRLIEYDVLCIYGEWETVRGALARIGERFSRANPLARAGDELGDYLPLAERLFLDLYPALDAHARLEMLVSAG